MALSFQSQLGTMCRVGTQPKQLTSISRTALSVYAQSSLQPSSSPCQYGTLPAYQDTTVMSWLNNKEEYVRLRRRRLRQCMPPISAGIELSNNQQHQPEALHNDEQQQGVASSIKDQPDPVPLQPKEKVIDAYKYTNEVFPVGLQKITTMAEMVAMIKRTQKATAEECVHMLCRMGQLVKEHCTKHKRLEVMESRETHTAMEKLF